MGERAQATVRLARNGLVETPNSVTMRFEIARCAFHGPGPSDKRLAEEAAARERRSLENYVEWLIEREARREVVGGIIYRPFYRVLAQQLEATPGTFVTLDSLIDIGILNESQRGGMNAFMKKVVGGLCNQFQATPLVLGHPSKASMADGTFYSGTTAAKNSVRNQLIMKQPNKGLLRTLEIGRQSYGGMDSLDLIWTPGSVFKTRSDAGVQATDNFAPFHASRPAGPRVLALRSDGEAIPSRRRSPS